jgi:hypothetical protein
MAGEFQSRHVSISMDHTAVWISYEPPFSITLGSEIRAKEIRYKLKVKLRRWRPLEKSDNGKVVTARFDIADVEKIKCVLADLDRMLDVLTKERLSPQMVEEILGITSLERKRWNKDGRLPKSGTGSFKKGQQEIYFYLHPVAEIAKLAANPKIIAEWREADAKAAQKPPQM